MSAHTQFIVIAQQADDGDGPRSLRSYDGDVGVSVRYR
jgi:hypothetical protein